MRALAVLLTLSLCACFPNNARHRTIAKVTEGGLVVTGIVMLAVTNTQADCEKDPTGMEDCRSRNGFISGFGLALILAGLTGFFATVATAPDDPPAVK